MKKIVLFLAAIFSCTMSFAQIKGLVCEDRIEVRNFPDVKTSKVLYQLNSADEIKIYLEIGDRKRVNGTVDHWYKISENSDEYINAEYVLAFPCEIAIPFYNGPGEIDYASGKVKDYKKENGQLYFLFEKAYTKEESWQKISKEQIVRNRSSNATDLINSYVKKYTKDFFKGNKSLFKIVSDGIWKGSYKADIDGAEVVYYSMQPDKGDPYFLLEVNLKDKNYEYPYGIKIGMSVSDFEKIMGGHTTSKAYDSEDSKDMFYYYPRSSTYDMYVYYDKAGKVTRVKFYCGL